ncbi:N-acetyltransferase [Niabella terrae]
MTLEIIPETRQDREAIHQLHCLAFGQPAEARLVDLLRQDAGFIPPLSLVAKQAGHIRGHLLFTRIIVVADDGRERECLTLAPVAVLPDFQRQGIGGQLIFEGLERAKQLGHQSVIVLGHPEYYSRFGFREAALWQIECPYPVASKYFMALELVPGGLKDITGRVKYPAAFDQL